MRDFDAVPEEPSAKPVDHAPSPWQRLRRWLRGARAEPVPVSRFSDHALRDIGLTRSEAQERFARRRDPRF